MIAGVLRRAESIRSGRLTYRFESGVISSGEMPSRRIPRRSLVFSDSNWIERHEGSTSVSIHRRDYTFRYDETQQPDGSMRRTAIISRPISLVDRMDENRPPWFAGSFWHTKQLQYVEQQLARFRLRTPKHIRGVLCEVCELDIPAKDVPRVVAIVHPRLAGGAVLRLHVAPQLGFVLPLVEVLGPDGAEMVTYTGSRFTEVADQVYFPRQIRMRARLATGETRYQQFTIVGSQINEPVPDSEFNVSIPAGTRVQDERDGGQVRRFEVVAPTDSFEVVGDSTLLSTVEADRGSTNRVVAIIAAIGVVLLGYVVARRYLVSRR